MADPLFRTTTHLVAHALREAESALRDVLLPSNHVPPKGKKGTKPDIHRNEVDAILTAYGIADDDSVAIGWRRLADQDYDFTLWRLAHRNALDRPRPLDEDFREFFADVEGIFDVLLARFEERFLDPFPRLDVLLAKPNPSAADARFLRKHIPNNPITLEHFFRRVQDPAWLELLAAEGLFEHPPGPIPDVEGGADRPLPWPASRYLVRMAAVAELQGRVAEIALGIPVTLNPYVNDDFLKIALAIPPELALGFVDKARAWLSSRYRLTFPEDIGTLASKLASAGHVDPALDLLRPLLAPLPDPRVAELSSEDRTHRSLPEPRTPFSLWNYGQILKKHVPAVVDAGGIKALRVLCETLAEAVRLSRTDSSTDDPEDYSRIWRPAIEKHPQNRDRGDDLKDMLVAAVRDASEQLATKDATLVPAIVAILEQYQWNIFRRIALHVLRLFPVTGRELIRQRLNDPALFDDSDLWHEYALLLPEYFQTLSPAQQARILGRIEAGPNVELLKELRIKNTGSPPTEEDVARYVAHWQLGHLARFANSLPPDWKARRDELTARLGEVEHPDFTSYRMGVRTGPNSPKSADDLRAMPVADIIEYLRMWEAPQEWMGPSPEGLGRSLATVVASDPSRFAAEANRFRDLDPTYVRSLFSGLRDAVNAKKAFPWAPVLGLAQWVVDQGADTGRQIRTPGEDRDPGWGWAQKAIADLFETGFGDSPAGIPIDLRQEAWNALRPLTDDPDPTRAYEAHYGGSNMSPSDLSGSTTRGQAMNAVEQYGLWLRRYLEQLPDKTERIARGFDEMPEVREVLDRHLDPSVESSLTISSVYGRHFPWLALLDRRWAEANVSRIFPSDPARRRNLEAAWDTYVTFCPPYDNALPLLRGEYLGGIALPHNKNPSSLVII